MIDPRATLLSAGDFTVIEQRFVVLDDAGISEERATLGDLVVDGPWILLVSRIAGVYYDAKPSRSAVNEGTCDRSCPKQGGKAQIARHMLGGM